MQRKLFQLPDNETLYQALLNSDPRYESIAYAGIKTTGIFCRLSCSARKPLRENVVFFNSSETALEAGFRPCLKCRPLEIHAQKNPLIQRLLEEMKKPERQNHQWNEMDLIAMGLDPSTVRRLFKQYMGMTFLQLTRLHRISAGTKKIHKGEKVIDAQIEAGYASASGFRAAFEHWAGQAPSQFQNVLTANWIDTPLGAMLAIADERQLHLLEFHDRKNLEPELKKLQKDLKAAISLGHNSVIEQIESELNAYFSGTLKEFKVTKAMHGTAFQKEVWHALCQIPYGEKRSYAKQAQALERKSAVRAVANANANNKLAIVIPCHRVVGSTGSLTGYAGGIWRKEWLLEHEKRFA